MGIAEIYLPQTGWGTGAPQMCTRNLKAVAKDDARTGIDVGGCLHGHKLERCDVDGCFGLRGVAFSGCHDEMNAVLDLYRDGVAPGGRGPQMAVILGFVDAG